MQNWPGLYPSLSVTLRCVKHSVTRTSAFRKNVINYSSGFINMAKKMMANTGRIRAPVSIFRTEDDDIFVSPKLVSRSLYVIGFKATTKSEDLMIHFQRKKNGGGDIDSMMFSERGAAAIIFDSTEGKT